VHARDILLRLGKLESDPYGYDSTELVGWSGIRRSRCGDYRVVYVVREAELVVVVVEVGHRSVIY
jgi:mRNA interferase RelE/StbE